MHILASVASNVRLELSTKRNIKELCSHLKEHPFVSGVNSDVKKEVSPKASEAHEDKRSTHSERARAIYLIL